jgi:hypothetical protein
MKKNSRYINKNKYAMFQVKFMTLTICAILFIAKVNVILEEGKARELEYNKMRAVTGILNSDFLNPLVEDLTPRIAQVQAVEIVPANKWEEFVIAAEKVAEIYNFPVNVVLAQGALESARGKSNFALQRNNFLGIGAYDSDPNQAFYFENPEQCVIEYMRVIKRNFPEAWSHRDNPDKLLELLVSNSKGRKYATDPHYVGKVKKMPEWNH